MIRNAGIAEREELVRLQPYHFNWFFRDPDGTQMNNLVPRVLSLKSTLESTLGTAGHVSARF